MRKHAKISNKMNKQDSKTKLLSQGLPFEFLVAKELNDLGLEPTGDYEFFKSNKSNERVIFSIDNTATFKDEANKIIIELLVEVKYSNDDPWIFFKDPNKRKYCQQAKNGLIPISLEEFDIQKGLFENKNLQFEYAAYGLQASSRKEDYNRIIHGCKQLNWAFIDKYISQHSLISITPEDIDIEFGFKRFYAPIIITNADLLMVSDNITLDDLQRKSIDEITSKKEIIPFFQKISSNTKNEAIRESQRLNLLEKTIKIHDTSYFHHNRIGRNLSLVITESPTVYWICNLSSIKNLCQLLLDTAIEWNEYKHASA